MKTIIICLVAITLCLAEELKVKRNAAVNMHRYISPYAARRQAWNCHEGCKKFCLPSCKRSCCQGSPNYTPQMFPQLIQYQASISNPPQLPPACPANCNPACYPNCDFGCCASQPRSNPACSPTCAPNYDYACCHSRPVSLASRPMVPGKSMTLNDKPSKPAVKEAAPEKAKPKMLFEKANDGKVCVRKCQNLCNPKCKFECCLPTHLHFDDDPPPHHDPPKVDRKVEALKKKLRDSKFIHPLAMPQRVNFPNIHSPTHPPLPLNDRRPRPGCRPGQRAPCVAPTTSPFGPTTDPFDAMDLTEPYGMTDMPFPTQQYYPQNAAGTCPSACPPSCAPACSPACCQEMQPPMTPPMTPPMAPPMAQAMPVAQAPPVPIYAGSPGLLPLGQAPTTCSVGCSDACAPTCSETCCQQFPQVVHIPPASSAPPLPGPPSPGLSPLGQASTCPGACPNLCAPTCTLKCCIAPQVVHVPPVHMSSVHSPPIHLSASHPAAVPAVPMHAGSPGLKPLGMASTCPGRCPSVCAPTCSVSCCAAPPTPQPSCPSPSCPNACAPACEPTCCANDELKSDWDRRSLINRLKK